VSRESEIEDRLRGRLTGPTGEAEFQRHAADDLEWCLEQLEEVCRISEADMIEDAIATIEHDLEEAREASKKSDELEAAKEKAERRLSDEEWEHGKTKEKLEKALDRLAELEGPEAAE
jgi:long-subunit acyl-CoA synthetase (AMP-forming)